MTHRSVTADNEYTINHYHAARRVLRHHLDKHRWRAFGPGTR